MIERGARSLAARLPGSSRTTRDPFAAYRSLDGPELVGGPVPGRDPGLDDDPRLVVLMPHLTLSRMSGGPNTILQITARLLRLGVRLRYVATFGGLDPDPAALRRHLEAVTGAEVDPGAVDFVDASAPGATLGLGRDDVLFATWWPTAHLANAALPLLRAREFVYLVQDFEPGFYPWSTKYALALATYDLPIRAIVNEPLLLDHLRAERVGRFEASAAEGHVATFMPAVDRDRFARRPRPAGAPRRLVFYARPRNPRNLFELGLRALRAAAAEGIFDGAAWEFRAIGQELDDLPLSGRHVLQATPWLSYEDYAAFLGEADVLLSLMLSPHTSYPPLEMAVAGGSVVTNTFGAKTSTAMTAISPAIRAVPPDVGSLVTALREVVASGPPTADRRSAAGLPNSWDEALREVVPWLHATIAELRGS